MNQLILSDLMLCGAWTKNMNANAASTLIFYTLFVRLLGFEDRKIMAGDCPWNLSQIDHRRE